TAIDTGGARAHRARRRSAQAGRRTAQGSAQLQPRPRADQHLPKGLDERALPGRIAASGLAGEVRVPAHGSQDEQSIGSTALALPELAADQKIDAGSGAGERAPSTSRW